MKGTKISKNISFIPSKFNFSDQNDMMKKKTKNYKNDKNFIEKGVFYEKI